MGNCPLMNHRFDKNKKTKAMSSTWGEVDAN